MVCRAALLMRATKCDEGSNPLPSACCRYSSEAYQFRSICQRLHESEHHAAFDYWLGRLFFRQQEGDRYSYAVLKKFA